MGLLQLGVYVNVSGRSGYISPCFRRLHLRALGDRYTSSTLQPVLQPRFVPAKKEETPKLGRILFVLRINGQRNFRGWFAVVFFLLLRSGFQYTQVPLLMVDEIAGEALDKC